MHLTAQITASVIALSVPALADLCGTNAKEIGGNWYCSAVEQLQYTNVGTAGQYNQITHMGSDGSCQSVPRPFSGPLAPLNGEVSLHFRGPIALKQFASYTMTSKKRSITHTQARRHGHAAFHARHVEAKLQPEVVAPSDEIVVEKRADMVVATIDGQVVSWENNWFGPSSSASTAATTPPVASVSLSSTTIEPTSTPATKADVGIAKSTNSASSVAGTVQGDYAYTRTGYYDSESQALDGLTFLGNYGGAGSGVWDTSFGNSLSYINSEANGCSASAQILADTLVASNQEFTIMTDKECDGDSCGYVRPGAVAYHGFDGADKVFLFEFSMPSDGSSGFNSDMPAIWMLNAEIPRTLQYGNADCSCWTTGCGEFDIVEVLSSGSMFCKSTLHTNTPGGDSNYIVRPTTGTMKLAVIFQSATSEATIQVLPSDTNFTTGLSAAQVASFTTSTPSDLRSLFSIVS